MFSPTSNWLYIPVRFLTGLLLVTYYVRQSTYWDTIQSLYKKTITNRSIWLEKIANLNTAESALRDYRKQLVGQLAKGELTYLKFEQLYQTLLGSWKHTSENPVFRTSLSRKLR